MTGGDTRNPPSVLDGFRKILVVCSVNETDLDALQAAQDICAASSAEVTVLTVVELPPEIGRIGRAAGVARSEIENRLVAERHQKVSELVAKTVPNLRAQIAVKIGTPFIEIVRYAVTAHIDLVIKAAEVLHGIHRYLFASTDQHLLRKCPCPVWLRCDGDRSVRTILAAVDVDVAGASEPDTQGGLNRRILETAARLAAANKASVHVLHVWDALGEGLVRRWSTGPDKNKAAEDYISGVQAEHWRALTQLVVQARESIGADMATKIAFEPSIERGDARSVVPAQARELKADILVMGTVARTGIPGFIIGNTAEDILNSVECSVVTVKPPNYVSPIQVS